MDALDLVPIYLADRRDLVERLAVSIEREVGLEVRLRRPSFDPELAFDTSRGQYGSTVLLRLLLDERPGPERRVLGVAGVDLFIPVLTFVFGEAQLGGRAAVVSIHRLRPEAYGLPADERLLMGRLHKEALHELGHNFGLVHCNRLECVMHASTYVEEIDLKSAEFCESCRPVILPRAAPAVR